MSSVWWSMVGPLPHPSPPKHDVWAAQAILSNFNFWNKKTLFSPKIFFHLHKIFSHVHFFMHFWMFHAILSGWRKARHNAARHSSFSFLLFSPCVVIWLQYSRLSLYQDAWKLVQDGQARGHRTLISDPDELTRNVLEMGESVESLALFTPTQTFALRRRGLRWWKLMQESAPGQSLCQWRNPVFQCKHLRWWKLTRPVCSDPLAVARVVAFWMQ